MAVCPLKKKFGFGEIKYCADNDCRRSNYEKRQLAQKKREEKDRKDEKRAREKDKKLAEQAAKKKRLEEEQKTKVTFENGNCNATPSDDDGFTKVTSKNRKLKSALKKNGGKDTNPDGTAMTIGQRNAAQKMQGWLTEDQSFVDARKADNDIKN